MTMIERDTKIRLRAETGVSFGNFLDRLIDGFKKRLATARARRARRQRIHWLLEQEDWKLDDMGVRRGDLLAELEGL